MLRNIILATVTVVTAGCAASPAKDSGPGRCYTEAGVQSPNGCSIRAGYPDCYLVCPDQGTRRKL